MKLQKGIFLISEPFIKDPAFGRTVILLVDKNELGTIGFVLNHQLNIKVSDVVESIPLDLPLFQGGPVAHDSLHFIYKSNRPVSKSVSINPGLYWGGNIYELLNKIEKGQIAQQDIRFFMGYSGWEPNQLEFEMNENTWIMAPADIKSVFEINSNKIWKQSMKSLGGEFALMANSPVDPQLN